MTALTGTGRTTPRRAALRWLPTFFGFPLGGLAAKLLTGPVDGLAAAIAGGLLTGIVLGLVQAFGLAPVGPSVRSWVIASGAGLAVGLGIGAAVVGYGTSMGDLAVQGVICGLVLGAAQAVVLRPRLGHLAFAWPLVLGAAWALGWTVTTAIGVDVEAQYTVFGSSGALTVTILTAILPAALATRTERSTS